MNFRIRLFHINVVHVKQGAYFFGKSDIASGIHQNETKDGKFYFTNMFIQ